MAKTIIITFALCLSLIACAPSGETGPTRAFSDRIIITGDWMDRTINKTEQVYTLQHEACHVLLGHTEIMIWTPSKTIEAEVEADRCALPILADYGYDPCLIPAFFDRLVEQFKITRTIPPRREVAVEACQAVR